MSIFYNVGETKKRPGIYRRHSNIGLSNVTSALDGYCAIPVRASWGPLGKVVTNKRVDDLTKNYGTGEYSTTYTVPAAEAMFKGGAKTVYTYRLGTGGKQASKTINGLTVTAKYPGTMEISIEIKEMLTDATKKQILVYVGTTLMETHTFAVDGKNDGANLIKAVKYSEYITITGEAATVSDLAVASGKLEGGEDPTGFDSDAYNDAFLAFEPYFYNTIALDVDDDTELSLSIELHEYLKDAYTKGKLGIAVVGEKTESAFVTRMAHAKLFNDEKVVFLGGGYYAGTEKKDGVMAICYTAGLIAGTPSNQGITHSIIKEATELCESLTYSQYEDAIDAGMLLLSASPDGDIWFDTGINTLRELDEATQDAGWKKIRRVKVRFEMIDRLDRQLLPKVGKVSCDTDGVADVVQAGQRVLDAMANNEGKLLPGASFTEDPAYPHEADSAWFEIKADDIDSLEKIYLHYQFRYSQNV